MPKLIKKLLEPKTLLVICLCYFVLITIAFLSPVKSSLNINFVVPIDKTIHCLIYLVLMFIWNNYFYFSNNEVVVKKIVVIVLVLSLVYGIIIEIIQEQFVQNRGADVFDILANMIGAILGIFIFLTFKNRIKS